jgi:membrane dipeptidase
VAKALKADDIRLAKAEGKRAVWLNTQLATGMSKNFIDLIEPAYEIGLRMVQLSYNPQNLMAAGCTERNNAGVSNYGAQVIAKMNELGIIIDISHCSRQTTLDACELSKKPVIASHTAAQGVHMHVRGKSDEEFQALAETGGLAGIAAVQFFFAPPPPPVITIEHVLDHIDYVANLVGWEHVAIGTDWPLAFSKSFLVDICIPWFYKHGFRKEDRVDESADNAVGFDDYRSFPNFTRGLVKRGYTDEQIKGILGENFLRVFQNVCG